MGVVKRTNFEMKMWNVFIPNFFSVSLDLFRHWGRSEVEDLESSFLRPEDDMTVARNEEAAEAVAAADGTDASLKRN